MVVDNADELTVFMQNYCLYNLHCRTVLNNFKTEVHTEGIVGAGDCRNSFSNIKAYVIVVFEVK